MPEAGYDYSKMKKDKPGALGRAETAPHGAGMIKNQRAGSAKTGASADKKRDAVEMRGKRRLPRRVSRMSRRRRAKVNTPFPAPNTLARYRASRRRPKANPR